MSVSIKYKGNEIAKLTETGTKTLNTEGKYCEGNISVENTELETEEKTVELSMPSGNQTVSPSAGKFLSAVTVKKPATMLPENIKSGVNIGGVVGTLKVANLQDEKSVSVTANGTVEVAPDEGYDGVKKVSVAVNVPSSSTPATTTLTITLGSQYSGYVGIGNNRSIRATYNAGTHQFTVPINGSVVFMAMESPSVKVANVSGCSATSFDAFDVNAQGHVLIDITGENPSVTLE